MGVVHRRVRVLWVRRKKVNHQSRIRNSRRGADAPSQSTENSTPLFVIPMSLLIETLEPRNFEARASSGKVSELENEKRAHWHTQSVFWGAPRELASCSRETCAAYVVKRRERAPSDAANSRPRLSRTGTRGWRRQPQFLAELDAPCLTAARR